MNSFCFIMASDAQYPWVYDDDKRMGKHGEWAEDIKKPDYKNADEYAEKQVSSFKKVIEDKKNSIPVKGIMMNGDMVSYNPFNKGEMNQFNTLYCQSITDVPFFTGLGNHDYQNNINDTFENRGASGMVEYHVNKIKNLRSNKKDLQFNCDFHVIDDYGEGSLRTTFFGSMSYSFNIEDIHFIQLNNFPGYENKWGGYNSGKARRFNVDIRDGYEWLANDLHKARENGYAIVVCAHRPASGWKKPDRINELFKKYDVNVVFVGHEHKGWGPERNNNFPDVEFYYCGATSQCHYLLLTFEDGTKDGVKKLTVEGIYSKDGDCEVRKSKSLELRAEKKKLPSEATMPEGYVIFKNTKGVYVAKGILQYTDEKGKTKRIETDSLALGNAEIIQIPKNCSDFKASGKYYGLGWSHEFFEMTNDYPFDGTFEFSGTTFSPKIHFTAE